MEIARAEGVRLAGIGVNRCDMTRMLIQLYKT